MNNSRAIVPIGRGGGGGGNGIIPPNSNRLMPSSTATTSATHRHPSHHPHPHHQQQHHHLQQRPGTSSTASMRPGTATSIRIQPPTLLCNLCQKPLATTCFLCACDCIFCEECTYSHFEQSSQCPICQKTLTENDFTELVVADATSATTDIAKTSLQALFSKQSKSSNNGNGNNNQNGNGTSANNINRGLPYSDLCFSLIRQIDVVKQSTKFLLKQLLMHSNTQTRRVAAVLRQNEKLKSDFTLLKQGQSTQRIQYEQMNTDLKNKLNAREMTIQELNAKLAEKEKMLDQFRRLHGGNGNGDGGVSNNSNNGNGHSRSHSHSHSNHHMSSTTGGSMSTQGYNNHHHQIPPSTGASNRHRSSVGPNRHQLSSAGGSTIASTICGAGPPLKGLMMQRQAHQINQQEQFASRRGPITQMGSQQQHQQHQQHHHSQGQHTTYTRPYSSNNSVSSNSISSNTPRVRDLSHGTAFNFTGGGSSSGNSIGGGGGGQRLNKRRRGNNHSATPSSHAMSPNTAFTLNQGAHTVNRGPRWTQKDGRNYSFG